jgi:putative addiction module component (TIGR02574 family)
MPVACHFAMTYTAFMVAKNLLHDVLSLPARDRMELFARLSDSLQEDSTFPPLSEPQERELDRRYAEFLKNPDEGYSVEQVDAMLKARRKP